MGEAKTDVLQGTLDLMVLKTLEALGPLHGYGIARRIGARSQRTCCTEPGNFVSGAPAQQRGWIKSEWGTSENNRKAKFYQLSPAGCQLAVEPKTGMDFRCNGAPAQRSGRLTRIEREQRKDQGRRARPDDGL